MTQPELETESTQTDTGFRDVDGFVGPYEPGNGPRQDPRGDFPTGPAVGERLPEINSTSIKGTPFDLLAHNQANHSDQPAVVVFFRSAVW